MGLSFVSLYVSDGLFSDPFVTYTLFMSFIRIIFLFFPPPFPFYSRWNKSSFRSPMRHDVSGRRVYTRSIVTTLLYQLFVTIYVCTQGYSICLRRWRMTEHSGPHGPILSPWWEGRGYVRFPLPVPSHPFSLLARSPAINPGV